MIVKGLIEQNVLGSRGGIYCKLGAVAILVWSVLIGAIICTIDFSCF